MPIPITFNRSVDRQALFVFNAKLRDKLTQVYYDISTWSFHFKLLDSNGVVVAGWDITVFTRPDNFTISFTKTISDVSAVPVGNYTVSLLVTNSERTDDEWMKGTWNFKN